MTGTRGPLVTASGENLLTDNPGLYEAVFPDPSHRGGRFADGVIRRFGGGSRVVDMGCGTGRDAGFLFRHGYDVTGVDASEAMVAYARARNPDVTFVRARYEEIALEGRFDVVLCLDSALLSCHSNESLASALARFHSHLVDGGLLVLELRNGAHLLGDETLVRDARAGSVIFEGTEVRWTSQLWIDHQQQLLRRRRTWEWEDAPALVQTSAWRVLLPLELAYFLEVAGFRTVATFDGPGPRTTVDWTDEAALSFRLSGDRLHVVARALEI